MHKRTTVLAKLTKNFDFPGLIFDVVLSVTILGLSRTLFALLPAGDGFWREARELILLFLYTFGLLSYLSSVYYDLARKHNRPSIFRIIGSASLFYSIIVVPGALILVALAYSILSQIHMLTITGALIVFQGLLFGFSIGIEVRLERDTELSGKLQKAFRKKYDHTLQDCLPYLLLTVVVVFPIDFLLQSILFRNSLFMRIIILAPVCYGCYSLARVMERTIFKHLEIKRSSNLWTSAVVSTLSALALSGFVLWELSVVNSIGKEEMNVIFKILILLFVGVIPIRIAHIVLSRISWVNKIISGSAILFLIVRKLTILEWT